MSNPTKKSQWQPLDADEAGKFLQAVASPDEPVLFNPSLCEVHKMPLSFYDGYALTRIVNKHMLPYLLLDFLSNGEKHYYMDGSDQAFHNLNAQGAISLDKDNVTDYVDLYISYVYERGNSLAFISDPHATSHKGSAAMELHFRAITHHQESSVRFDDDTQRFVITTPLIYQEQTVQSHIEVTKNGGIYILEPVKVSFLETLKPTTLIPYRHPQESRIVEQTRNILSGTQTGENLLKTAGNPGVQIRVLSSPNYQGFTTNDRVIYIIMPSAQGTADYLQALVLAGCLRDVAQMEDGLLRQHPAVDEELYALSNYGKNLDIIMETCKMVKEFEDKNIPEALSELRKMGLESLYSGHINKLDDRALMATYRDMLKRYGFIPK